MLSRGLQVLEMRFKVDFIAMLTIRDKTMKIGISWQRAGRFPSEDRKHYHNLVCLYRKCSQVSCSHAGAENKSLNESQKGKLLFSTQPRHAYMLESITFQSTLHLLFCTLNVYQASSRFLLLHPTLYFHAGSTPDVLISLLCRSEKSQLKLLVILISEN